MSESTSKKRKLSLPLILAGGVSSLVLALGMSPTFSAFTASITNSANSASMGTLSMAESTTGTSQVTCNSNVGGTANCTTNLYGGSTTMVPGTGVPTDITIKNTGTVTANGFSVVFGTCSATPTTPDLCAKMLVEVKSGSTVLTAANSTAASLNGTTIDIKSKMSNAPVLANAVVPFTVTVTMPSTTAAADNTFQGASISQNITWTFQS